MVISAANPLSKHRLIIFIHKANFHLFLLTNPVQNTEASLVKENALSVGDTGPKPSARKHATCPRL